MAAEAWFPHAQSEGSQPRAATCKPRVLRHLQSHQLREMMQQPSPNLEDKTQMTLTIGILLSVLGSAEVFLAFNGAGMQVGGDGFLVPTHEKWTSLGELVGLRELMFLVDAARGQFYLSPAEGHFSS